MASFERGQFERARRACLITPPPGLPHRHAILADALKRVPTHLHRSLADKSFISSTPNSHGYPMRGYGIFREGSIRESEEGVPHCSTPQPPPSARPPRGRAEAGPYAPSPFPCRQGVHLIYSDTSSHGARINGKHFTTSATDPITTSAPRCWYTLPSPSNTTIAASISG